MRTIRQEFEASPDPNRRWFPDPFVPDTVLWSTEPDAPARPIKWGGRPRPTLWPAIQRYGRCHRGQRGMAFGTSPLATP